MLRERLRLYESSADAPDHELCQAVQVRSRARVLQALPDAVVELN